MSRHFFISFCFACVTQIVTGQIQQREGIVSLQSAIYSSNHQPYIWFKDSAVIFENIFELFRKYRRQHNI